MTEQNSKIDFSSILEEAEKHSTSDRQNQRFKKHMWVTLITGSIILAFAGYLIFAFASKTDFNKDVPLSENISRWTPLNWETDGISDEKGKAFTANGVKWTPAEEGQFFTSEVGDSSCTLKFAKLGNGLGSTDQESTDKYTQEFMKESVSSFESSNVWLETTVGESKVEVVKSSYENAEGSFSYSYYRGTPENNGFIMLIASCDDSEALKEILPDQGGSEVAEIALLRPSTFSPF